jgi:apolipoprotein N-acyltransferase
MDMRRFGVVICFEDIFSDPFRRYCSQKLSFMVNMTNDAWFQKSGAALQHANLAIFRAVENRIPLLRATNTGYTCLVDPYGRIQSDVRRDGNIFVSGILQAQITPQFKKTLYAGMGDFFAHACLILALVRAFVLVRNSGDTSLNPNSYT